MTIDWSEIKDLLPPGWELKDDPHNLLLVDPNGKVKMVWSARAQKEFILKNLEEFFGKKQERC